jgi:tight adherence protein B
MMLMLTGAQRLSHRAVTSRRVAELLDERGHRPRRTFQLPGGWRFEAGQAIAQLQSHDSALRGPTVALACVAAMIGLATLSPLWFVLALASALAAYALGDRQRRRQRIEAQALDAMTLLASGLRAGYSVSQAMDLVATHSPRPTATEFAQAGKEIGVGVDLSEAFARLARRTANTDYELVAIIIGVHTEVGGNLAQVLDSVGSTLRERLELRRQVNALTAQQRLSSMVLTVLPFALLMFLFTVDRSFVDPLFTEPVGRLILTVAGAMVFVGWTIMRSIGRVEV